MMNSLRKYHRWIATAGLVTILYLSLTGLLVIATEIGNPETTRPIAEEYGLTAKGATLGTAAEIETLAQTVLRAARKSVPDAAFQAVRVQLRVLSDRTVGTVTLSSPGSAPRTLAFDAHTGAAVEAVGPQSERPKGNFLWANAQQIHSGEIYGTVGQWLILATGAGLVVLSITGTWMYFVMLFQRRRIGRSDWLWK